MDLEKEGGAFGVPTTASLDENDVLIFVERRAGCKRRRRTVGVYASACFSVGGVSKHA